MIDRPPITLETLAQTKRSVDLRRSKDRTFADLVLQRAQFAPAPERALLHAIYRDGRSIAQFALLSQQDPRLARKHLRDLIDRLFHPAFLFVAHHRSTLPAPRRDVAIESFIHGRSARAIARGLNLSYHLVRQHRQAIIAMAAAAPITLDPPAIEPLPQEAAS